MVGAFQFFNLTVEYLLHLLRPFLFRRPLLQFRTGPIHGRITQLFLDSLDLLIQNIFLLLTINFLLRLVLNVGLDFQNLDLFIHIFKDGVGTLDNVRYFQKTLFLRHFQTKKRSQEVDQEQWAVYILDSEQNFLRKLRRQLHHLGGSVAHGRYQCLEHLAVSQVSVEIVGYIGGNLGTDIRLITDDRNYLELFDSLHNKRDTSIGHGDVLQDTCHRTHIEKIGEKRILYLCITLCNNPYLGFPMGKVLRQLDGLGAPHRNRKHGAGIQHGIAQRKNRHLCGNLVAPYPILVLRGKKRDKVIVVVK